MRFVSGKSRFVILTETKAIKIARFKFELLRFICIVNKSLFNRKWLQQKLRERNLGGTGPIEIIGIRMIYLFGFTAGIHANRQEYKLYQENPDLPLAKVLSKRLKGFVLVMERGEPVDEEESKFLRARYPSICDLDNPNHVCKFPGGVLKYIDYGDPTFARFLLKGY